MGICQRCKEKEKIPDTATTRSSYCRECKRLFDKECYKKNWNSIQHRKRKDARLRRQRTNEYILQYLLEHPCIDCGENDIVVLDFDHVRGVKIKSVSQILVDGSGNAKLQKEIDKCEVRCANCHRRKTAKQPGLWRYKLLAIGESGTPPASEAGELASSNLAG